MIEFNNIVKKFNVGTPDEATLFENFNLKVKKGEYVSVVGSNGSGKTTMLNLLCGSLPIDGGSILLAGKDISKLSEFARVKQIGRVFQALQKGSASNLTILENMALADNKNKRFSLTPAINKKKLDYYRTLLETCGMGLENRMNVAVGNLSGGEKARLALLTLMLTKCNLLLLDEPTNHLDIASREALEQALMDYEGTLFIVSHDRYFVNRLADRLYYMDEDGLTEYAGNYDYYEERRPEKVREVEVKQKSAQAISYKERRERESQARKRKGLIERTEKRIEQISEEISALDESLSTPEVASDYSRVLEISAQREQLQSEEDQLYAQLEELYAQEEE